MKQRNLILCAALLLLLLSGCASRTPDGATVAATTYPVAQFTEAICAGTDITVTRVITDAVSCLHDYSISVTQMRAIESADAVILSGVGLEDFMDDALALAPAIIDASEGIALLDCDELEEHDHDDHGHDHGEHDPHIWLNPALAKQMVANIAAGLSARYPDNETIFRQNAAAYCAELDALLQYGSERLSSLSTRELITFHDGFAYFADAFSLTILRAIEEESGSEASAAELREIVSLVQAHALPAIFTERNSASAAAEIISRETGCAVFTLDMGMGGTDYLTAMRQNIDSIAEALK